jgi:hypothetical protein
MGMTHVSSGEFLLTASPLLSFILISFCRPCSLGRVGYQDYSSQYFEMGAGRISAPKEIIVKMLQRENELRLSSETQMEYKSALLLEGFAGFVRVTENLQKQVAKEFNFSEEEGLEV